MKKKLLKRWNARVQKALKEIDEVKAINLLDRFVRINLLK
jgi:hypothetical protein